MVALRLHGSAYAGMVMPFGFRSAFLIECHRVCCHELRITNTEEKGYVFFSVWQVWCRGF